MRRAGIKISRRRLICIRRLYLVAFAVLVLFKGGEWIVTGRVRQPVVTAVLIAVCLINGLINGWPWR